MSQLRVAISSPSFCSSKVLLQELAGLPVTVVANSDGRRMNEAELIAFLSEARAEVAIIGLEPFTRRVVESCKSVKIVCKYGVGTDNLDHEAMRDAGVALGWTAGVNRRSVSELVLAFALGHCRNAVPSVKNMLDGKWLKAGGRQLSNATMGIVGFGHIGTDLAGLLRPFSSSVLACDVLDKAADAQRLGAEIATYAEILARSDVITFHVPSTPKTRNMFAAEHLKLVKPDVLLINTSRGDIVAFDTVCEAVRDGKLGGFAADVYPDEPYDASRWRGVEHLYFTPHIGGNAREAVLAMGRAAISHVQSYVKTRAGA